MVISRSANDAVDGCSTGTLAPSGPRRVELPGTQTAVRYIFLGETHSALRDRSTSFGIDLLS